MFNDAISNTIHLTHTRNKNMKSVNLYIFEESFLIII